MKSCLDPSFKYTPSGNTDLAKTFARVRREQAERAKRDAEAMNNVEQLPTKRKSRNGE